MTQLKLIALLLLWIRLLYWIISEQSAQRAIPKTQRRSHKSILLIVATYSYWFLFSAQLLGLALFPFPQTTLVPWIGFVIFIAGEFISVRGRIDLGVNWSHGAEYQVKKSQSLVTTGMYRYVRHPIYSGFFFIVLGGQLIVESYLVIPLTLLCYAAMHVLTRKEERILIAQFGKHYSDYMIQTPQIFPRIF